MLYPIINYRLSAVIKAKVIVLDTPNGRIPLRIEPPPSIVEYALRKSRTGHEVYMPMIDIIGFAASALVFMTFCMRTLLPLRLLAILSNLAFIAYGFGAELVPILVLHLLLLPMNIWRTAQQFRTRRKMREVLLKDPSLDDFFPFMTIEDVPDDTIIFNIGDAADRLYFVVKGEVRIEEFGRSVAKGEIFGEIGCFASDRTRTATARALKSVKLGWIDRETIMRVYRENPDFALFLTRLMVTRLVRSEKTILKEVTPPHQSVSHKEYISNVQFSHGA